MLDSAFGFFVNNWFTIVLSIVSILVTWGISALHSKQSTKNAVRAHTETTLLIQKATRNEKLEILYESKPVTEVRKTRLFIWNSGAKSITKHDVIPHDQITIDISNETSVLSLELKHVTRKNSLFEILGREIIFHHWEPEEGIIIEIFHTKPIKTKLSGSLLSLKSPIRTTHKNITSDSPTTLLLNTFRRRSDDRLFIYAMLTVGFLSVLWSIWNIFSINTYLGFNSPLSDITLGDRDRAALIYAPLFAGCLYIIFPIYLLFRKRNPWPKTLEKTIPPKQQD